MIACTMAPRVAAVVLAGLLAATGAQAVSGTGTIYTIAGSGAAGFSGDNGRATAARLTAPAGVAVDGVGNVYVVDTGNHRIRRVTPAGVITTIAGTGTGGFSGDGGRAASAQLLSPQGIAVDNRGTLYVADTGNNRIRRITTDGTISTLAGNGVEDQSPEGLPATHAALNQPAAVAVDNALNVYIAEADRVLRIAADGTLRTVAGALYSTGFNGDGIPAVSALLDSPSGIAVDAAGSVFIADTDNHRVRKVGSDGTITTLAGTGRDAIAGDGGPATAALINSPRGVAVGADGAVYVGDRGNQRIRKILANGTITTVAGGGETRPQFGRATRAELGGPTGIALDGAGNLYVANTDANRVDKVSDLVTEVGTVARAWVSATRAGAASWRLPNRSPQIWAHFVFARLPDVGLPIVVEFYGPRGRVAIARRPAARRLDVGLRRQRGQGRFVVGRWRAVLRVAGKPVATISFGVR